MAEVVFDDGVILVVDKPAGLPTQATRAGEEGLYEQLRATRPTLALHHRLDRPASGLVLFGVDPSANAAITRAFREHAIERTYLVVVGAEVGAAAWTWPIDGRPARTEVRPVGSGSGWTAAEVVLTTGRKHQIRRHAAMAGAPVVGDRRYGGELGRAWDRLALHAWRLGFGHPADGRRIDLTAELPAGLRDLWRLAGGA